MQVELRNRLTFGPLMALAVIGALCWDIQSGHHLGVLALLVGTVLSSSWELRRMSRAVGNIIPVGPLLTGSLLLLAWYFAAYDASNATPHLGAELRSLPIPTLILACCFIWMCLVHMSRYGAQNFTRYVGMGMLSLTYLGVCAGLAIPLTCLPDLGSAQGSRGTQLFLLLLVTCKTGDVWAFTGGKLFGRHKMCPSISPGKTWEGFAFALVGSLACTALAEWLLRRSGLPPSFSSGWHLVLWSLVLAPVGVLGDLVESCLKRDAGVKDSGKVIPGFGGFLDIFDAVILAAPLAYLIGILTGLGSASGTP